MFKSAFISILGLPNAGKSTLLNAMLDEELVITNKKAQTTRHRIKGILNAPGLQLVFSDTPGIINDTAYLLQDQMMKAVKESVEDADVLLFVLDVKNPKAIEQLKEYAKLSETPIIVALNKVDLSDQELISQRITEVQSAFNTKDVFPVSALEKFNLESLVQRLEELAPEHPPYYDPEIISDENVRFLVTEMIREQMLSQFKKEIPYSAEVVIDEYEESEKIDRIRATVFLERDSQRIIVIGKGGQSIKKLGTEARKKIQAFLKKKVFLGLSIKIRKNWRKDEVQLKRFGYIKD